MHAFDLLLAAASVLIGLYAAVESALATREPR